MNSGVIDTEIGINEMFHGSPAHATEPPNGSFGDKMSILIDGLGAIDVHRANMEQDGNYTDFPVVDEDISNFLNSLVDTLDMSIEHFGRSGG